MSPLTLRVGAAALAATALAATPALANRPGDDDSPGKRIAICHATSSPTNPYVFITVAADSILDPRTGEVEGHGTDDGTHGRDIIPAFSFTWGGRDYEYAGKNLDGDGAEILANRCRPVKAGPADPGENTWDDEPLVPGDGRSGPGDPGDPPESTPSNRVVIEQLDEVAPEGLGDVPGDRRVNEAAPGEAVLRVTIRPSLRRPRVGQRVVFRVTGRALGPAAAADGTLCAAVPAGFSLADAGSGMVMGRVICWFDGIAAQGASTRSFVAVPRRSAAGRAAVAPATNSATNAYRVEAATVVRPRLLPRMVAVTG